MVELEFHNTEYWETNYLPFNCHSFDLPEFSIDVEIGQDMEKCVGWNLKTHMSSLYVLQKYIGDKAIVFCSIISRKNTTLIYQFKTTRYRND